MYHYGVRNARRFFVRSFCACRIKLRLQHEKTPKNGENMIKIAIRLDKIGRLNETSIEILKIIIEKIGAGTGRVDYGEIAERLNVGRSSVKYAIEQMVRFGTIKIINRELSVRESVVWFEE